MAACVIVPQAARGLLTEVNDSKVLIKAKREALATVIQAHCLHGIGSASVAEIDSINIRQATHLAMRRAFDAMCAQYGCHPVVALIDGRENPNLPCPALSIIKGDSISVSIAAAAIIAKVARDALMARLHDDHPDYGWATNAGYGVPAHQKALARLGPTPHHRHSYAPIRALIAKD